jgi:hypothetical protein
MKKAILMLASILVLAGLGCKKERWLRVYHAGVFKDSINVTGWEPNEDVVRFGDFYYPWQGEDSIDYTLESYFWEDGETSLEIGESWSYGVYLIVNNKIVGLGYDNIIPPDFNSTSSIITLLPEQRVLGFWKEFDRFPNLIGVRIGLDAKTEFDIIDSIPSAIRLYLGLGNAADDDLRKLAKYKNIRVLILVGDFRRKGVLNLLRLNEMRILEVSETKVLYTRPLKLLPHLRRIDTYPEVLW